MNVPPFSPDMTVADALEQCHELAAVLVRFRMACVGCPLAAFETLEDAADAYGLTPKLLMLELEAALAARPRSDRSGASN
ncbi:MAG: DUF1858 domain-containing protein [Rudaea sp.]